MKRNLFGKLVVGLGVFLGVGGIALASNIQAEASTLYRAYNPNTGEHLYTQNGNEIPSVVKAGWRNEGTAWQAPSTGAAVYRMFNPNNGGDHFYTLNAAERDHLKQVGWRYEGISWESGGSTPVYRLYNPNAKSGTHHYTTLSSERDHLRSVGWRYEGVAFYSGAGQSGGTPTGQVVSAPAWTKNYPSLKFGTWYSGQENGMIGQYSQSDKQKAIDTAQELINNRKFNPNLNENTGELKYTRWVGDINKQGRWYITFFK